MLYVVEEVINVLKIMDGSSNSSVLERGEKRKICENYNPDQKIYKQNLHNTSWRTNRNLPMLNPTEIENILADERDWDTEGIFSGTLDPSYPQSPASDNSQAGEEFKEDQAHGLNGDFQAYVEEEGLEQRPSKTKSDKKKNEKATETKKKRIMLDDFLRILLEDPQYNSYIQWTIRDRMEFKLTRPEMVAQLWGELRKKKLMNYDKLSRGLRYYYESKRIVKIPFKQHHFRFVNRDTRKQQEE